MNIHAEINSEVEFEIYVTDIGMGILPNGIII